MKKEIGSEFWSIPVKNENKIFENVTWFISGRAALRAIIRQIKCELEPKLLKIALPSYLCESMIMPLEKENVSYKFYSVLIKGNSLVCDYSSIEDCNVIVLMDYFGYENKQNVIISKDKILIRDLTHSIFVKEYDDADYYFGSLRKWAGFLCGGFAYKKNGHIVEPSTYDAEYINLRSEAMNLKSNYINGKSEGKSYLEVFSRAEKILDSCDTQGTVKSDINSAKLLDVELLKSKRRINAQILINEFKDICLFKELGENDCPLFVPIIYKNRDSLRRYLIENSVYCPVHWPKPDGVGSISDDIYNRELSLICDQRYSAEDMKKIVKLVKKFMESD